MAIRHQARDEIDHAPCPPPVPRVLHLTDVFQLIMHSCNESPLTQEQFGPQRHEAILPVRADGGQPCEPLAQEEVMPGLRDGAALSTELAAQPWRELFDGSAVVDLAWRHRQGP